MSGGWLAWCSLLLLAGLLTQCRNSRRETVGPETPRFHCHINDPSCPEIAIDGDPFADLFGRPATIRGYGDPSLESDPDGTLWLSYTWINTIATPTDSGQPIVEPGLRTHLARSTDQGATFQFVRAVNEAAAATHPVSRAAGRLAHEVSTLVREPTGRWQMLWLQYFIPRSGGMDARADFLYGRTLAPTPSALGDLAQPWIRSSGTPAAWGAPQSLSAQIPELANCAVYTEPALLADAEAVYLATQCLVFEGGSRRDRIVLLKQTDSGYAYLGDLLYPADAATLGAERIEQIDLSRARNGDILLLGALVNPRAVPEHQGCVVFTLERLEPPAVERDAAGGALLRARLTGDGTGPGVGLCTYDAGSRSGVMMVLTMSRPPEVVWTLHATGVHP